MAIVADPATLDVDAKSPLWLLQIGGSAASDLLWEPLFLSLLERALPEAGPRVWGGATLSATISEFLSGNPGNVLVAENRYLLVSGAKRHFGRSKGLLWIDCESSLPAIGFIARSYYQPGQEKVAICVNTAQGVPAHFLVTAIRWLSSDGNQSIVEIAVYGATGDKKYLDPQIIGISPRRTMLMPRKAKRRRVRT